MTKFDVLRVFDDGITNEELDQAVERSAAAIEEMRSEGERISYLGSDVFEREDGNVGATMCHYDAESESMVRDQSERAELPFDEVFLTGTPVPGIAPESGVVQKVA